jgi:putative sigma-54 modulation protein
MKVVYKGIPPKLSAAVQKKLDARFAKLGKLLDGRGERGAHVVVVQERHQNCAEITVHFYDHELVGKGSDPDLMNSLTQALGKIETQAVKTKGKWREQHRRKDAPKKDAGKAADLDTAASQVEPDAADVKRIFRVNGVGRRKPMTLDEAVLEMDNTRDYLVYRDSQREGVSVLVRRRDGNFDLIES